MAVDVLIEDERWGAVGFEPLAEAATDAALAHLKFEPGEWEIAILACNDARIAELNTEFRGKPVPTNVLSWPSEERGAEVEGDTPIPPQGDPELGDIAIAFETCEREAKAANRPFDWHVQHLLVHGTLHLLGYDHISDADGDLMETVEVAILATLGVPNPYEGDGTRGPNDYGKD